jgi:hypothetical protein
MACSRMRGGRAEPLADGGGGLIVPGAEEGDGLESFEDGVAEGGFLEEELEDLVGRGHGAGGTAVSWSFWVGDWGVARA